MATIRRYAKRHPTGRQANTKSALSHEAAPEEVLPWQR
jgi:hypothetical protein